LIKTDVSSKESVKLPARDTQFFTKRQRLLKAGDFNYVFDSAIRSGDQFFTVLVRPNYRGYARLGLVISKKKAKRAVARNRLKRLIRESFRHTEGLYHADIIVLAGNQSVKADNKQLFQSLEKHWQRVNKKCAKL